MATTYDRMRIALQKAGEQDSWPNERDLAEAIRTSRPPEFKMRGDGSSEDDFMKAPSITRLIRFAADLGLIQRSGSNESVSLTASGRRSLQSDGTYRRQIQSSAKSLLEAKGASLDVLETEINGVALPDVPDADTLFERMEPQVDLTEDDLRRLLFLLACAEGIDRVTRVHYRIG